MIPHCPFCRSPECGYWLTTPAFGVEYFSAHCRACGKAWTTPSVLRVPIIENPIGDAKS